MLTAEQNRKLRQLATKKPDQGLEPHLERRMQLELRDEVEKLHQQIRELNRTLDDTRSALRAAYIRHGHTMSEDWNHRTRLLLGE